jgi:hypothetical protein
MNHTPSPDNDPQQATPDPSNPAHRQRLAEILRLLEFHGFYVAEAEVWGDPRTPVRVRVEGSNDVLTDYALIREAVAQGLHDPHTLLSLYTADLRVRGGDGRHRRGRPGAE